MKDKQHRIMLKSGDELRLMLDEDLYLSVFRSDTQMGFSIRALIGSNLVVRPRSSNDIEIAIEKWGKKKR